MKKFIKLAAGIIALIGIIGVGIIIYQNKQDVTIRKYTINEESINNNYPARDLLIQAVETRFDSTLKTTSDATRGYQIYLIQNAEQAEKIGYKMPASQEDFIIRNLHHSIYIFANNTDTMNRATAYFARNLIDDQGRITLKLGESHLEKGMKAKKEIMIGKVPITEYHITYSEKEALDACKLLQYYVYQTGNVYLDIQNQTAENAYGVSLIVDKNLKDEDEYIRIENGQISIKAKDAQSLKESVYLFANAYLGWMYAGQEEEHINSVTSSIYIPENDPSKEAWIEEREAIIVLWNINYNRGFYLNGDTTLENNLLDYSEEQLYEYVRMLKYCGFTGVQITEMCSAWAGAGGYEAVHEKIRMIANAAHSMGMNVTLWVWGAEFTGYGWVDDSVVYYEDGYNYSYESPKARETFEKYYNIYAELAEYCDRVIGHFYDPGNLKKAEDIGYYCKLLRDKFHAVNPDIDFGISCWVDAYDKTVLVRELGNDITLYEGGHHDNEGTYESFRSYAAKTGCRLGTWAWNTCEMEIDQLAQMNFNMDIIRSVYQTARKYDDVYKPSYWSEMDSYHVLNVFSLYCAGQMLINPDIESDVLYKQISEAAVGKEYADAFSEMLRIIQDARSGSEWSTYEWQNENYILKSDAYDAEDIISRCNKYIPILEEMISKELETNTLPLPIKLKQLLQMIQPHLYQIREFAEFRIAFKNLKEQYANGTDIQIIEEILYDIGDPINSYNCIIGTWGQIEARAQREMILEFCSDTGVEVPIYGEYDKQRKEFIYAQLAMYQRGNSIPVSLAKPYYQYGFAYTEEETARLVQEMVDDGWLIRTENDMVYLKDWKNYSLHFN